MRRQSLECSKCRVETRQRTYWGMLHIPSKTSTFTSGKFHVSERKTAYCGHMEDKITIRVSVLHLTSSLSLLLLCVLFTCVCAHTYTHMHACIHMHTPAHMHTHMHMHACIHMHMCTHAHTRTHAYTHAHAHTNTSV